MENNKIASAIIIAGLLIGGAIILKRPNNSNIFPKEKIDRVSIVNKKLGLNNKEMLECIEKGEALSKVERSINDAVEAGVRGTPHSFVLYNGVIVEIIKGAQPEEIVQDTINKILNSEIKTEIKDISLRPLNNEDSMKGNPNAPIVIIEYSDTECPFCKNFHKTMNSIIKKNENVAWVYRHYPLSTIHPNAKNEAVASLCAKEQGGDEMFWKYIDTIFE